jgi:hypothetical protein
MLIIHHIHTYIHIFIYMSCSQLHFFQSSWQAGCSWIPVPVTIPLVFLYFVCNHVAVTSCRGWPIRARILTFTTWLRLELPPPLLRAFLLNPSCQNRIKIGYKAIFRIYLVHTYIYTVLDISGRHKYILTSFFKVCTFLSK